MLTSNPTPVIVSEAERDLCNLPALQSASQGIFTTTRCTPVFDRLAVGIHRTPPGIRYPRREL